MTKLELAAVVAVVLGVVALVVSPVYIAVTNSTQRLESCVENGGAYVHVPETSIMECQR